MWFKIARSRDSVFEQTQRPDKLRVATKQVGEGGDPFNGDRSRKARPRSKQQDGEDIARHLSPSLCGEERLQPARQHHDQPVNESGDAT